MASNNYTVVIRFSEDSARAPENRFLTGIVNAVGMGTTLWIGLFWMIRMFL